MPYLVKLPDGKWLRRGKAVSRIDNATIYPHPSAAALGIKRNPGAELIPLADVRDQWMAARSDLGDPGAGEESPPASYKVTSKINHLPSRVPNQ